jgi:hypothetical protein
LQKKRGLIRPVIRTDLQYFNVLKHGTDYMDFVQPLSGINRPCQTAQQLAIVLNIPLAYLYCGGYDLAVIHLQISSASDERIREIKLALN